MDNQDNDNYVHSIECGDNRGASAIEMRCELHGLQGGDHMPISALQVIWKISEICKVIEPKTLVAPQRSIESGIYHIRNVSSLTD